MKRSKKKSNIRKLFFYLREHKLLFFSGLFMVIVVSFINLLDPLIIAHIIDVSVPRKDVNDMMLFALLFLFVVLFSGFISYFQTIILAKLGLKIVTKLKGRVFSHLLKLPVSFFDKNPVGSLMARVESDGERVKQLFSNFAIMILGNIFFFLGMLGVLFYKNWKVTLYLMIPLPLLFVVIFIVIRYLRTFYKKIRKVYASLSALLAEYINGVYIVQLFNKEKKVEEIIDKKSLEKRRIETKTTFIEYSFWGLYSFLLETGFIVLVILLVGPKVIKGIMSVGTLVIFIQYGMRLFEPLIAISENINFFQRASVSLNRIFGILGLKKESDLRKISISPVFEDKIVFKDVWFRYKDDEWVLKGVDFTIKKGEKIAFVGASGSGKTTTVSLLCGFYNINRGSILVDGKNIEEFNIYEWRRKIGLILQDIYLFPGTILENIRIYNDEINEKRVVKALEYVQARDFLEKREDGLHTFIKDRGKNISQGEKQLLSFARALVFSPEIIIMDEATSSVDVETEEKIKKSMDKLLQNKTAVIVAHRLSSVINADRILLFESGSIIAQGTHDELLKKSSVYKRLVELQFLKGDTHESY